MERRVALGGHDRRDTHGRLALGGVAPPCHAGGLRGNGRARQPRRRALRRARGAARAWCWAVAASASGARRPDRAGGLGERRAAGRPRRRVGAVGVRDGRGRRRGGGRRRAAGGRRPRVGDAFGRDAGLAQRCAFPPGRADARWRVGAVGELPRAGRVGCRAGGVGAGLPVPQGPRRGNGRRAGAFGRPAARRARGASPRGRLGYGHAFGFRLRGGSGGSWRRGADDADADPFRHGPCPRRALYADDRRRGPCRTSRDARGRGGHGHAHLHGACRDGRRAGHPRGPD